jgi:predicted peptidase
MVKNLSSIIDENAVIAKNSPIQKQFLALKYISEGKELSLPYRLHFPSFYTDVGDSYPLMIFLHGAVARGKTSEEYINNNPLFDMLILNKKISKEFPCIIAAPQCPNGNDNAWSKPDIMQILIELVNTLAVNLNVDTNRIYVTGVSMGGFGTFDLLSEKPDLFAAGMPICGGSFYGTQIAEKIKNIPIWAFHAADDYVVPVKHSREIVMAIENVSGKAIRYTEYKTGGHFIWNGIYSDLDNLKWLFAQKKNGKQ